MTALLALADVCDTSSGRPLAPPASGLDRSVRDIGNMAIRIFDRAALMLDMVILT